MTKTEAQPLNGIPCPYCKSPYGDCAYWCYTYGTLQEAMWTDRMWFLEHPGADMYWRDFQPFDIQCKTFDGLLFEDGKPPKMAVSRINDYVRVRHYPDNLLMLLYSPDRDQTEIDAAKRWWLKTGTVPVNWKPTPKSFPSEFLKCESPVEQMFFDGISDAPAIELAYVIPQVPISLGGQDYRLDFADADRKLCIEIDGLEYHNGQDSFMRDRSRERALQMDGWRVLRFAAKEVMNDAHKCVRQAAEWAASV